MNEDNKNEMIFKIIYNKRKLIFIITTTVFIMGFIYAFFIATPLYKSTTTLYPVMEEQNSTSKLQIFAAQFGFMGLSVANDYNIPDVVQSRKIRESILKRKWILKNGKEIDLYKFWGFNSENKKLNKEKALKKLNKAITVFSNDDTGLITISALTEDPRLSADIVNFIAEEVSRYIQTQRINERKKYSSFIEKQVNEVKKKLIKAENKLEEFIDKNRIISKNPKIKFKYEKLKREIEIQKEIYISLEKQKELAKLEEKKKDPVIRILDIGEIPANKFKPKRLMILITSLLIGIIIGILSSFINWNNINFIKNKKLL
ncbi:GNVR domain-containing protein [Calditrichota bacterium GD2]